MSKFFSVFNIKKLPMDLGRLAEIPLLLFFRLKKYDANGKRIHHIKTRGGKVIVSNHVSFIDPFIVSACFPLRRMHFVIADVVMGKGLRRILLRGMGGIEIKRDIFDVECIKKSIHVLNDGHLLSVFAQGHIDRTESIDGLKSGAVLMAIRSKTPIIPVYIIKRKNLFKRQIVIVGEELDCSAAVSGRIPTADEIAAATDALHDIYLRCLNTADSLKGRNDDNTRKAD